MILLPENTIELCELCGEILDSIKQALETEE